MEQVQILAAIAAYYAKAHGPILVTDEFMARWAVRGSQLFIERNEQALGWDVRLTGEIIDGEVVEVENG